MSDKPLLYVILGAAGSGRREAVADLFSEPIAEGDAVSVLISSDEKPDASEAHLGEVTRWTWDADGIIAAIVPEGAETVVFVTDGRKSPIDQLEALKPWLLGQGLELARVLAVVNCKLAFEHPPLAAWYDGCIHFADVVLLANREGVPNKWISDFQEKYAKLYFPALFEFVKDGKVKNPALLLSPVPRRMTHYFEDEQEWVVLDENGEVEEEEDVEEDGEDEVEMVQVEDPYFVKNLAGRRVKELPDINKFLGAPDGKTA